MKKPVILFCLAVFCLLDSCKNEPKEEASIVATPAFIGNVDRSVTPVPVCLEKAIDGKKSRLKLSRIASEIDYYVIGDANFKVKQAISIPDSNAFITFNFPRIYYRKNGIPSKRYGFKALDYKWNSELQGQNLFYDKKTTRMFCALSGMDRENRESQEAFDPQIVELPPLDTMLSIKHFISPEEAEKKYPIHLGDDKLLGFSSSGYILSHYEKGCGIPDGLLTFNWAGEMLGQFTLKEQPMLPPSLTDSLPQFQTAYWNEAQDQLTFVLPFCDTVFQLRDPQTVIPLYQLDWGKYGIRPSDYAEQQEIPGDKVHLRTLYENPKGLFMGLYQAKAPKILNWLGHEFEYIPTLSYQAVYLKEEGETYILPHADAGFVNDLDEGMSFWPDGQTDDFLYMIRTVTEMRECVDRTYSTPKREKLLAFLDSKDVHENQYVLIVVK